VAGTIRGRAAVPSPYAPTAEGQGQPLSATGATFPRGHFSLTLYDTIYAVTACHQPKAAMLTTAFVRDDPDAREGGDLAAKTILGWS
jgi:hypothetical protein